MSTAYAPPPEKHPEAVPANRGNPNRARMVWLWLAIIVVFIASYRFFAPDGPQHQVEAPVAPPTAPWPLWPLALPALTLAVFAFGIWRLRARLPAKFRTWELRTKKREVAPVPAPSVVDPPPVEAIELAGRSQMHRSVRLRIDETGLHWSSEARLLKPAQWLEVAWSELQAFTVTKSASRRVGIWSWAIMIALGAFYGFAGNWGGGWIGPVAGTGVMAVIGGIVFFATPRAQASITFMTPTHSLAFSSRQLSSEMQERVTTVARSRRPELLPAKVTGTEPKKQNVAYSLFVLPYVLIGRSLRSDASIRAEYAAQSDAGNADEETRIAGVVQVKIYGLWHGGLCAALPLSVGAAYALMTNEAYEFIVAYLGVWIGGLILTTRLMNTLGRLTGMTIIR